MAIAEFPKSILLFVVENTYDDVMTVSLKVELERFIEEQVRAGHYLSAESVVEDALNRMMTDLNDIPGDAHDAIDEAEDQIAQGRHRDWKDVSAELRKKHLK